MLKKAGAPRPAQLSGTEAAKPTSPLNGIGKDSTVGDVIRALNKSDFGMPNFEWYYSEKNRLLIARPQDWIRKHSNLMPESLLADLKSKGNGSGIQLDDLSKLSAYNTAQLHEWVYTSKDLGYIIMSPLSAPSKAVWALYEKLPGGDKAAAKSEVGLPLAKLDPQWVSGLLKAGVDSDNITRVFRGNDEMVKKMEAQTAKQTAILTDPDAVQALTLRIAKVPAQMPMVPLSLSGNLPAAPNLAPEGETYQPELRGEYKGEQVHLTFDALYSSLPIYSPEREAALRQKTAK
jgi:hypothetical protein